MTFAYDTCRSCGKPFIEHDGIKRMCEKLHAAQTKLVAVQKHAEKYMTTDSQLAVFRELIAAPMAESKTE